LALLTATRSELTIDELKTVVSPTVVECTMSSAPETLVFSTLSEPPA
jgi:hypothetical protein